VLREPNFSVHVTLNINGTVRHHGQSNPKRNNVESVAGLSNPMPEKKGFPPHSWECKCPGLSNPDAATNTACKLNSKAFSLGLIGFLACQWVDLEGLSSQHIQPALQKTQPICQQWAVHL